MNDEKFAETLRITHEPGLFLMAITTHPLALFCFVSLSIVELSRGLLDPLFVRLFVNISFRENDRFSRYIFSKNSSYALLLLIFLIS